MALWQQHSGNPEALAIADDQVLVGVLRYLARERSAAASKIAFDLKIPLPEAAAALHRLTSAGLVRQVTSGAVDTDVGTEKLAPSMNAFFFLSEQGLDTVRLIEGRAIWAR